MKRVVKLGLGLGLPLVTVLVLFLLSVVPISVQYACWSLNPADCPTYSTHASVTYAAFNVGVVYITSNHAGPVYCWMEGNPVDNGAVCGIMTL